MSWPKHGEIVWRAIHPEAGARWEREWTKVPDWPLVQRCKVEYRKGREHPPSLVVLEEFKK